MDPRALLLFLLSAIGSVHAQFGPPRDLVETRWNNGPQCAAAFDADGDGDQDIILATSNEITTRRNDGTGLFTLFEASHQQEYSDPRKLAWGDLDGDGDIDLVQAGWTADSALIWLSNDGNGHFQAEQLLVVNGGEYHEVSLADLDDDGDLDIFHSLYGNARIFRNNGTGQFTLAPTLGDQLYLGLPADVDLDGDLDLVGVDPDYDDVGIRPDTGSDYGPWQVIDDVNGAFIQLLVSDLELDGDSDLVLVFPDHLSVLLNQDSGLYAAAVDLAGGASEITAVRAGDLTSDGKPDLLAADGEGQLIVFANNGDASFAPAVTHAPLDAGYGASDITLMDVDANGALDVLMVRYWSMHARMGDGAGGFGETRVVLPYLYFGAASGDMDGDGDLDILLSSAWVEQESPGEFTVTRTIHVGAVRQKAADFDGDGLVDTYTGWAGDAESDSTYWYHNLGDGQFERISLGDEWPNTVDGQAWDLDADGDLDLLRSGNESGVGVVFDYRNDGAGHLLPAEYDLPGGNDQIRRPAVADFDGDGDPDVACYQYWGPFSVYENEGGSNLAESPAHPIGTFPDRVDFADAGDIDGDGDADLVFETGEILYWYANNGIANGWTAHTIATGIGEDHYPQALGDIDADGDLDVMYRNDDSEVFFRLNDGSGNFGSAILLPGTSYDAQFELVDLDIDGDADLITKDYSSAQVYINTSVDIPAGTPAPHSAGQPVLRPNPVEETTTLELRAPLRSTDRVRILDLSGRLLRAIRGSGKGQVVISRGDLQAGVYLLHITQGGRGSSVRMVVR